MTDLGFVRAEHSFDIELVQSLWPHLRPQASTQGRQTASEGATESTNETILFCSSYAFMAAIADFKVIGREDGDQAKKSTDNGGLIGDFDEETRQISLSAGDVHRIHFMYL